MTNADVTIFVVDDDPSIRKSLLRLVRSTGWTGEAFASAEEFMARPHFSGTGCVLLDVRMPGMTGLELRDLMTAQNISLPVIFLTGHADIPPGTKGWNHGTEALAKPVDADVLLKAIRRALDRHAGALSREPQAACFDP